MVRGFSSGVKVGRQRGMMTAEVSAMTQSFVLEYWTDDGWYVGRLRGVPGVFSQGATLPELEENIREAYRLMAEDEEDAPEGSQFKELAIET